ncbi:TetR/AcrR family transcriptional regulator [Nonomuraea angiospora]|uniref:TetR/AcrR family transcriptional regulator n=1 Tax=Nonomuraea angiospora TaxID=46172 RepID=UPI0037A79E62
MGRPRSALSRSRRPAAASPSASADRVRRTLDVSRSLLLRSGYKRTTMDEIARRADIDKGTIYLSWDTKDDLIRTLVIQEIIGVCQGTSRMAVLRPPVARLSEFSRELFTLVFKYPLFRTLSPMTRKRPEEPATTLSPASSVIASPRSRHFAIISECSMRAGPVPRFRTRRPAFRLHQTSSARRDRPGRDPIWRPTPTAWPASSAALSSPLTRSRPEN